MPLFEVAVTLPPTKNEAEDGEVERLLYYSPEPIVARDQDSAALVAGLEASKKNELTDVERARMITHIRAF